MDDDFATPQKFGIGQPIRRLEDVRLLTGKGRYQDDQTLHRQTWCVFVRSPHAHAHIHGIDTAAAQRAPGVVAVFTGADYAADGIAMPKAAMPRKKRDGSPMFAPQRPALVIDRARYVGDPVAMVIADTLPQAKDAAELVVVDYAPLPSVTSVADAALPDALRVWDDNADNISHTTERGNRSMTFMLRGPRAVDAHADAIRTRAIRVEREGKRIAGSYWRRDAPRGLDSVSARGVAADHLQSFERLEVFIERPDECADLAREGGDEPVGQPDAKALVRSRRNPSLDQVPGLVRRPDQGQGRKAAQQRSTIAPRHAGDQLEAHGEGECDLVGVKQRVQRPGLLAVRTAMRVDPHRRVNDDHGDGGPSFESR